MSSTAPKPPVDWQTLQLRWQQIKTDIDATIAQHQSTLDEIHSYYDEHKIPYGSDSVYQQAILVKEELLLSLMQAQVAYPEHPGQFEARLAQVASLMGQFSTTYMQRVSDNFELLKQHQQTYKEIQLLLFKFNTTTPYAQLFSQQTNHIAASLECLTKTYTEQEFKTVIKSASVQASGIAELHSQVQVASKESELFRQALEDKVIQSKALAGHIKAFNDTLGKIDKLVIKIAQLSDSLALLDDDSLNQSMAKIKLELQRGQFLQAQI